MNKSFFLLKISLTFLVLSFSSTSIFAFNVSEDAEESEKVGIAKTKMEEVIVPEDITWTQRFILSELKDLRVDQETLKREIFVDIQKRELNTIDRALSYSANTLNFFLIFITALIMSVGLIGWKTIADVKKSVKEGMDKEVKNVIAKFQRKINLLERKQEVNVLWRGYYTAEGNNEKIDILQKIGEIQPESMNMFIEKSNVYLAMEIYDQVIEICNLGLSNVFDSPQLLFNRGSALVASGQKKEGIEDINHLLKISSDYNEAVLESEYLKPVLKNFDLN